MPEIRTIGLWNEQVDFVEKEDPFECPAVFIEFLPMKWRTLGGAAQQAEASIALHVVTPWGGCDRHGSRFIDDALSRFGLLDRIDRCLFNFQLQASGTTVSMFRRTETRTNHNHAELVEDIAVFGFTVYEDMR